MKLDRDQQPVIVGVTGHVEEKFIESGLKAGMNEVQSKPFYVKALK
jgi:CheY-like chemotaxis protein